MPHSLLTPAEPQKDLLNSSYYIVNNEFDSFSRKWFETEILYPSSSMVDDREDSPSPPSLASSLKTGQPYYMGFDQNEEEGYGEALRIFYKTSFANLLSH